MRSRLNSRYERYLVSPHWIEFRKEFKAKRRAEGTWRCFIPECGSKNLDLHHCSYARLGREQESDIVLLCRHHHQAVHFLVKRGARLLTAHRQLIPGGTVSPGRTMRVAVKPSRKRKPGKQPLAKNPKPYSDVKRLTASEVWKASLTAEGQKEIPAKREKAKQRKAQTQVWLATPAGKAWLRQKRRQSG